MDSVPSKGNVKGFCVSIPGLLWQFTQTEQFSQALNTAHYYKNVRALQAFRLPKGNYQFAHIHFVNGQEKGKNVVYNLTCCLSVSLCHTHIHTRAHTLFWL